MSDPVYDSYMGRGPKQITHGEIWSCPDAETFLTGIDYYDHPRLCRERLKELYPQLGLPVPPTDDPKPRPQLDREGQSSDRAKHVVRWGDGATVTWQHGEAFFKSLDEVLAFRPLEKADFTDWPHVVEARDYSSEEVIYRQYLKNYPPEWGGKSPGDKQFAFVWFYNTMFMWPLLAFGWEYFLQACLLDEFAPVMEQFAEINRRVFRAFARLPVDFVLCHDDIVTARGPVCSPQWMHKHIFPRYEEFWGIVRAAGKRVVFVADGNMDAYVDDVMACGAAGIVSEPFTDYKAIARKYENPVLAGEGDNRVLMRNDRGEIRRMVESMAETGRMSGGYLMSIGNHIPWDIPPAAIKYYLDLSAEIARR